MVSEVLPSWLNNGVDAWKSGWSIAVLPTLPSNVDVVHEAMKSYDWFMASTTNNPTSIDHSIYTNGNVGIGTTFPTSALQVLGDEKIKIGSTIVQDKPKGLYFHSPHATNYSIRRGSGSWTGPEYQQLILDWPTGIVLDPGQGDNAGFAKSYVEITGGKGLRVTQGRVGIKELNPVSNFQIGGQIAEPENYLILGKTQEATQAGLPKLTQQSVLLPGVSNDLALASTSANGGILFYTGGTGGVLGAASNQLRMAITNTGVGIGTQTPDAALTVAGTVHAEEFIADLNVPAPDYVFEPDYPRLSLDALRQYVTKHKHLPNIPSSDELMEGGVNLLDMNMKLLEKVEELTLYILELKAESDKQQKEIDSLKEPK